MSCSSKWTAYYLLVLKFICFINILLQNLQILASFFIVSSQNGHNFVLVLLIPIIDAKDLNNAVGMPAGSSVTPKKVEPTAGLPFLVM
jgi:hypothetical protein